MFRKTGLFLQMDRDRRSANRRDPRGGDICRRARLLEPALRLLSLSKGRPGLRACPTGRAPMSGFPLLRRRAQAAGSRQSQERCQQRLVLRPLDQPHVWRSCRPLWRRRSARARLQAARQGQGQGRRQVRPNSHFGAAAVADVLLVRRSYQRRYILGKITRPLSNEPTPLPAAQIEFLR